MTRSATSTLRLLLCLVLSALIAQQAGWTDSCGCGNCAGGSTGTCAKPGPLCGSCGPHPPCSCMDNSLFDAPSTYSGCQTGASLRCSAQGCGGSACRANKGMGACGCVKIPQLLEPIYQGWVALKTVPTGEGSYSLMVCVRGIDGKPVAQPNATLKLRGPSGTVDVPVQPCRCCLRADVKLDAGEHYEAVIAVNRPGVAATEAHFSFTARKSSTAGVGMPCGRNCAPGACGQPK